MSRKLKNLFKMMLLFPIIPALRVGEGDEDEGEEEESEEETTERKDGRAFTQDEVDALIAKRLARAEKSWKKKSEDEAKKKSMSEIERLKKEKEEAETAASEVLSKANQRLVKAEVISISSKLNIIDADTAYILMDKDLVDVTDDGKVKGVEKALGMLIKEKPFLAKKTDSDDEEEETRNVGDNQQGENKKKGGTDMNSLIRTAAGRK